MESSDRVEEVNNSVMVWIRSCTSRCTCGVSWWPPAPPGDAARSGSPPRSRHRCAERPADTASHCSGWTLAARRSETPDLPAAHERWTGSETAAEEAWCWRSVYHGKDTEEPTATAQSFIYKNTVVIHWCWISTLFIHAIIIIYVNLEHKTRVNFVNKSSFHWCMVCYDRTIFENLESEGAKKSKYWENHL